MNNASTTLTYAAAFAYGPQSHEYRQHSVEFAAIWNEAESEYWDRITGDYEDMDARIQYQNDHFAAYMMDVRINARYSFPYQQWSHQELLVKLLAQDVRDVEDQARDAFFADFERNGPFTTREGWGDEDYQKYCASLKVGDFPSSY